MTLITLELEPKGKGRPRVTFKGGYARAYTPATTAKWEKKAVTLLRSQWQGAAIELPVKAEIDAIAKRPKRLCRKKDPAGLIIRPALPDADNVAKAVFDVCQKARIIDNDKLVVDFRIRSLYSEKVGTGKSAPGRVLIKITTIKEGEYVVQPIDGFESVEG